MTIFRTSGSPHRHATSVTANFAFSVVSLWFGTRVFNRLHAAPLTPSGASILEHKCAEMLAALERPSMETLSS